MPRLIVMHVVFRSLLEIFGYATKQACKQLHCNKAKLSEPASINGLHIHRALGYPSQADEWTRKYLDASLEFRVLCQL